MYPSDKQLDNRLTDPPEDDDDGYVGVILCTLCRVYGLGHEGEHLVP